jgi:hypothetical protein
LAFFPEISMLPRFENSILFGEAKSSKLIAGMSTAKPENGVSGSFGGSDDILVCGKDFQLAFLSFFNVIGAGVLPVVIRDRLRDFLTLEDRSVSVAKEL